MLSSSSEIASTRSITFILALYACLVFSCTSKELEPNGTAEVVGTPATRANDTIVATNSSDAASARLTELYSRKNCKEFINAFPTTFQEFDRLYRLRDGKSGEGLYAQYPDHFAFFFECPEVGEREKIDKVIALGAGSKWDEAVPIDDFGELAFDLIRNNSVAAKEILDKLPDDKAGSFWYFLFDRPHPSDKENLQKVGSLKDSLGKDSKQSKLLEEQYQKLKVDWSKH